MIILVSAFHFLEMKPVWYSEALDSLQEPIPLIFFVESLDDFGRFSTSKLGVICHVDIAPKP